MSMRVKVMIEFCEPDYLSKIDLIFQRQLQQ